MKSLFSYPNQPTVPWTAKVVVMLIASLAAISVLLGFLWNYMQWEQGDPTVITISYALQVALSGIACWWFAIRKYKLSKTQFRWRHIPFSDAFGIILAAFVINICIGLFFLLIQYAFSITLPGFEHQAPHVPLFGDSSFGIIALAVIGIIIAPLIEEFIFRGIILATLSQSIGSVPSILLTSGLFAGIHFEFATFFPLFILGCVMGHLFLKYRSLPLVISFHLFNNAIAFAAEMMIHTGALPPLP